MSDQTKTILISAVVVGAIYAVVEFGVKPKVSGYFGVKVR